MARPFIVGRVEMSRLAADLVRAGRLEAEMGRVHREVANRVASLSRAKAVGLGGVHRHVSPGIMAVGPAIGLDVGAQPAILGAEFGGGARPRTRQFPPWRGSGDRAGYMVHPTIREMRDEIDRAYEGMIDDTVGNR